jgi:hypothetical protein
VIYLLHTKKICSEQLFFLAQLSTALGTEFRIDGFA